MRKSFAILLLVLTLGLAIQDAKACGGGFCGGGHAGISVRVGIGFGGGGGCGGGFCGGGRFPRRFFRAPIRRFFGLPGFTPVRQFLFGRGRIRRQFFGRAIFP